jgi:hypothetical protein
LVGATSKHQRNHFFTASALKNLEGLISSFFKLGWGAVGVNDGSLVWGGRFEIEGGWVPPPGVYKGHAEHREGEEVDIAFNRPIMVPNQMRERAYWEMCDVLNASIDVTALWHRYDAPTPPHFHVYLLSQGNCRIK